MLHFRFGWSSASLHDGERRSADHYPIVGLQSSQGWSTRMPWPDAAGSAHAPETQASEAAKKAIKAAIEALAQERQASVSSEITAAILAERERLPSVR